MSESRNPKNTPGKPVASHPGEAQKLEDWLVDNREESLRFLKRYRLLTLDAAEDVIQSVHTRLHESPPRWVLNEGVSVAVRARRFLLQQSSHRFSSDSSRRTREEIVGKERARNNWHDSIAMKTLELDVRDCMDKLGEQTRKVVTLHYGLGITIRAVAERCGLSKKKWNWKSRAVYANSQIGFLNAHR